MLCGRGWACDQQYEGGGVHREAVPFGLGVDAFTAKFSEESSIDVALAPLDDFFVRTLAVNNTVPVPVPVPVPATADMIQLVVIRMTNLCWQASRRRRCNMAWRLVARGLK